MSRRKARETALQMLFQLDVGQNDWPMVEITLEEAGLTPANKDFAACLVHGAREKMGQIDQMIEARSREWDLDRLANVDKNILRLAIWELTYGLDDLDVNIIINEAIELAKKFSTEDSGAFVNAILDNIVKEVKSNKEKGAERT
jgi:N utilization substance protein B